MLKETFDPHSFFLAGKSVHPCVVTDFNGVLDTFSGWTGEVKDYDPAEGSLEFVRRLREEAGFKTVIVQTATLPLESVQMWIKKYGFDKYVDYVTNHKPPGQAYIDDRGVYHDGNFDRTLRKAMLLRPHWAPEQSSEEVWPNSETPEKNYAQELVDEMDRYLKETRGYSTSGEVEMVCDRLLPIVELLRDELAERSLD